MAKADGSVLITTEIDSDGVAKGTKKIKEHMEGAGKSSESSSKKIGGALADSFKKLGAAIASAAIVDKLIEFGSESIKLGSDLEEVQNVVDVTFSTMSDRVDEFAKSASKAAGLSETMAKKYVGTFGAMANSFGFAEAEAYEMATALTQLSGDVASFYNLSQDEAYTKLKSVFTGETESLKDLGVVMTQTALDSYSLANGFGKVTSQMTEQEKVALRYSFVMDQLSGASGDFVRTQESWANQTKVLALQWESLKAVLGSGLIQALSPLINLINEDLLPAMTDLATEIVEAFEPPSSKSLEKSMKSLGKSVKDADKQFEESSETIEKNALMAERYANRLKELEAAGLDSAEAQMEYAHIVDYLNSIYPELNLQIDAQTNKLDAMSKSRLRSIDAMKQEALYRAQEERYTAILEAQADAVLAVKDAQYALTGVSRQRIVLEEQLAKATGLSADELIRLYNNQVKNNAALKTGTNGYLDNAQAAKGASAATKTLTADQVKLVAQLIQLTDEEIRLKAGINNSNDAIAAQDAELQELLKSFGFTEEEAKQAASAINGMGDSFESATEEAKQAVEVQIGLFDKLEKKSETTADQIVQNWRDQQAAFTNYRSNLQKAIDMGLDEALVEQLSDGTEQSMLILDELVSGTGASVDEINKAFKDRMQAKELLEIELSAAKGVNAAQLQQMLDDYKKKWPQMTDVVKKEVDEMQKKIDSLAGKTFYIKAQTTPSTGKNDYVDFGAPASISGSSTVPMLATGAVIPPNAPFMAVLGDQRRGTNIEAPLATIQEAVAAVMGDMMAGNMAGHEATVAALQAILEAINQIDTSDERYANAVDSYQRKMAIARGG